MIEHRNLTGSSLHEPKGVATALEGSVYVANGAGSGVWRSPLGVDTAEEGSFFVADGSGGGSWLSPSGNVFGSMCIVNNESTVFAVPEAVSSLLNTDTDYVKVNNGLWTCPVPGPIRFDTDHLTIPVNGVYEFSVFGSLSSDVVDTRTAFKIAYNDTQATLIPQKVHRQGSAADVVGSMAMSFYTERLAGDKISLWVAATKACNIRVTNASLSAVLLKAL